MRDRRQNQRVAGSRVMRRRERQAAWWEGRSWDALLAYGITAIVSLALFWLLAQIALDVALIVLLIVIAGTGAYVWLRRRRIF